MAATEAISLGAVKKLVTTSAQVGLKQGAKGFAQQGAKVLEREGVERITGRAAGMQQYGHLWQKASLDKAISRHAGLNATSWVTKTGKTIFENPATARQVVVDPAGYFRIFQS